MPINLNGFDGFYPDKDVLLESLVKVAFDKVSEEKSDGTSAPLQKIIQNAERIQFFKFAALKSSETSNASSLPSAHSLNC